MRTLIAAALILAGLAAGTAPPANACEPYDGSCGFINPDPDGVNGNPGWVYGQWYAPGWYWGHYWGGGPWRGYW